MYRTPSEKWGLLQSPAAKLLPLLAAALAVGGCVGADIDELNRNLRVASVAEPPSSSIDTAALHLLNAAAERPEPVEYVLGPGDVVQVSVYQLDTLGQERQLTLTVCEEGQITLPLIGRIQAAGLSGGRLAEQIRQRLERDFIHQPRVKVEVVEHHSRVAAVMGAVARPGRYPITGRAVTLLDLLGRAGGITERADDAVHVVRGALTLDKKPSAGEPVARASAEPIRVRLSRLIRQGGGAAPTLVYPGDLVTVNQKDSTRFYVSGHVVRPGSYARQADMTLFQGLTVAGGLAETADPTSLKIIRQLPQGGEELVEVNLTDIAAGRRPDVRIKAADLVVVPTTPGRRARAEVQRLFSQLLSVGVDARYRVQR